jgi:hypothetical protein
MVLFRKPTTFSQADGAIKPRRKPTLLQRLTRRYTEDQDSPVPVFRERIPAYMLKRDVLQAYLHRIFPRQPLESFKIEVSSL